MTAATDFSELTNKEPWLSSTRLVVKPDMLFGKRGKSGLVALNLDLAQVSEFVKTRLGVEVMHWLSNFMANFCLCLLIRSLINVQIGSVFRLRWVAVRHR